jgi:hypothetical protein
VGVLTADPQEPLDVYGNAQISGTLTVDRFYANLIFANQGADHAFLDFEGRSRLLLGSANNTFLYGCVMPSVTIPTLKVASSAGTQLLSHTNAHLATFGAEGTMYGDLAGTSGYIEMDVNNHIRAKGTGNYRGRLYIVSNQAVGSEFYFGGGYSGSYVPDWSFFANPNGNLQLWRVGDFETQFIDINRHTGMVTFNYGHQNASDASLKTPNPPAASSDDALQMLKGVQARVYERLDLPNAGTRLGFIAQEVEAVLPSTWGNLVGQTTVADTPGGEGREIKTVDYARLVCCLWQANRSMLARIEALEARLAV